MILHIIFIVFCIHKIDGHFGRNDLATHTHENRQELIEFITMLNNEENNLNELATNHLKIGAPNDEIQKERQLKQILWLLKKNFDAQRNYAKLTKNPADYGARLYYIDNPETLQEYKIYLKKKKPTKSMKSYFKSKPYLKRKLTLQDLLFSLRRKSQPNSSQQNNFAKEFDPDKPDMGHEKMDWSKPKAKDWDSPEKERKDWNTDKDFKVWKRSEKKDWNRESERIEKKVSYESRERKPYKNDWQEDTTKRFFNDWGPKQDYASPEKVPSFPKRNRQASFEEPYKRPSVVRVRGSQGRTSMPIIGKRDIYENDK